MAKKTAYYGIVLGLAMICGYIEMILPLSIGIPGAKLGLANIVALYIIYKNGYVPALAINISRIVLTTLLFGNVMTFLYSLVGGTLAVTVMFLISKIKCFSPVGSSIAGAVFHNLGQIVVAMFVIGSSAVLYLVPMLTLVAVITGLLIGIATSYLLKKVRLMRL